MLFNPSEPGLRVRGSFTIWPRIPDTCTIERECRDCYIENDEVVSGGFVRGDISYVTGHSMLHQATYLHNYRSEGSVLLLPLFWTSEQRVHGSQRYRRYYPSRHD